MDLGAQTETVVKWLLKKGTCDRNCSNFNAGSYGIMFELTAELIIENTLQYVKYFQKKEVFCGMGNSGEVAKSVKKPSTGGKDFVGNYETSESYVTSMYTVVIEFYPTKIWSEREYHCLGYLILSFL